jgi:hypothetical protein
MRTITKSNSSRCLGIRLECTTLERLRDAADADRRSVSGVIRLAVEEWLEHRQPEEAA